MDAYGLLPGIVKRVSPEEMALKIVRVWLETPFDGGRHLPRVQMLNAMC